MKKTLPIFYKSLERERSIKGSHIKSLVDQLVFNIVSYENK